MTILAIIHAAITCWMALYGLNAFILLCLYLYHRNDAFPTPPELAEDDLPHVTVQVPVYNELHVVERVIDCMVALDYPRDKLHIQILDDSTDETLQLSRARSALYRKQGVDIEVLRRAERSGFKAGALNWGMARTKGEFIAIFDADFCPQPDFLLQTVPHFFNDPKLGMIQTRWAYLNPEYSILTRAQALAFNGHFVIEQTARYHAGLFMNFNGTGGVWRRACIEDAGGWQDDTLTEDLDLSYRAQLAGWTFLYLPHVSVPAELPPQVTAFKRQQFRWSQGTTQTLRKLGGRLLCSKSVGWKRKFMGLLHLSSYLAHTLIILHLLISLPMLLLPDSARLPVENIFGFLGLGPPLVFLLAQQQLYDDWKRRLRAFPMMLLLVVGIAWCSARAGWRGLTQWGGTFVRTPKFRLETKEDCWTNSDYKIQADKNICGEILLTLYALLTTGVALWTGNYAVVPFALLYAAALGTMSILGLVQVRNLKRQLRSMELASILESPDDEAAK